MLAGRLVAPGPGRFALLFTVPLVVTPTQKTVPTFTAFAVLSTNPPAPGEPVSRTSCARVPAFTQTPPPQSASTEQPFPSFVPSLQ
jgi:hypothetical protein